MAESVKICPPPVLKRADPKKEKAKTTVAAISTAAPRIPWGSR